MAHHSEFTHDLKLGKSLTLSFNQSCAAGYRWFCHDEQSAFKIEKQSRPISGVGIGDPSLLEFTITAQKPGQHKLHFAHQRAWESSPTHTRTYTINVQP